MLDRLKDVWYYTPLPPHNGYNDEALNCCIVHDCTTIYFGMSVKILLQNWSSTEWFTTLCTFVRFLHRTDDQLFSQINRTIAEMLLLRKIQNRPEKKYKEHILRNEVPNISVTCWWWNPEYVIWLWPCQKRKCKMENRTNPKLIPWQILACRNYEKSFTCCWDIKEEGCPVLQSTPPWSSSCSCWWWGSSWCSSSTSTLPSPPSTSSCGCAPFRF